jgi:hypothetical protein
MLSLQRITATLSISSEDHLIIIICFIWMITVGNHPLMGMVKSSNTSITLTRSQPNHSLIYAQYQRMIGWVQLTTQSNSTLVAERVSWLPHLINNVSEDLN